MLFAASAFAVDADVTGLVPTIWWDFETKPDAGGLAAANKGSASISFTSQGTATYEMGVTNGCALDTSKFQPYSAGDNVGAFSKVGGDYTVSLVMNLGTTQNGITFNLRNETGQRDLIVRRGSTAGSLVVGCDTWKVATTHNLGATFEDDSTYHLVSVVVENSRISLYVDGEFVDSTTDFTPWTSTGRASRLQFGSHLSGVPSGEALGGGCIDDLRIHDAPLTPAQMKAIAAEYGLVSLAIAPSGEPTVGKDFFRTPFALCLNEGDAAEAAIIYGTDAALSAPVTNIVGSALPSGSYTASLTGLASGTTYWWKIVASNGVNWAEAPVASFHTLDVIVATDYLKRIPIVVSGYAGSSALTNFPILVKLAAGQPLGFDYADCAADGSDIRFAASDGTMLSHEIESWDTNGTSYVWVKVPVLSGKTTALSLYYGADPNALPAVNPADVWTRYAAVFHGGSTIADSTGKSAAVRANTVTGSASGGKVGGVMSKAQQSVTGVQFSNPVKSGAMSSTTKASVSGWYKRSNSGNTVITAANVGSWGGGGFLALVEKGTYFSVAVSSTHQGTGGQGALVKDVWGHLAFACDGSNVSSYFNGSGIYSGSKGKTMSDPGETYWAIGSYSAAGNDGFIGDMDEVRFFNGVASADWIKAEYDSVTAPASFAVLGPVESTDETIPRLGALSASDANGTTTFSVELDRPACGGAVPTAVSVFYGTNGVDWTELLLGSTNEAATLTGTATGLRGNTVYLWYAAATATQGGVDKSADTSRSLRTVLTGQLPAPEEYKTFTATVKYEGAAAENVPVLLRISESAIDGFDYDDVTASGFEIVDGNGNLLPWEIDTWDETAESLLWVRLPVWENGATITVRYGAEFANSPWPASETWTDYVGVWHLNDTNTASAYGSYPNSTATAGIDGEKAQASIADEAGVFGKSVKICDATKQGAGYHLGGVFVPDSGAASPLDLGDTFVISGWFRHKNQDYYYEKF